MVQNPPTHSPRLQLRSAEILEPQLPEWQVHIPPALTPLPTLELPPVANRPSTPAYKLEWEPPTLEFCPEYSLIAYQAPEVKALIDLELPQLKADLQFSPQGAKLRPRSPYSMPGHSSQPFVVYSAHDGLPLHPGSW